MNTTQHDEKRAFGDPYIPAAIRAIENEYGGDVKVHIANEQLDNEEATDLVMLSMPGVDGTVIADTKFAFRVRKHYYWTRFPNDFTIRSKVQSDRPTEIHKIMDGFGDLFLYAFAVKNPGELEFIHWKLIDLNQFRFTMKNKSVPYFRQQNKFPDGTLDGSEFNAYDVRHFPQSMIIASSDDAQEETISYEDKMLEQTIF